MDLVILAAGMGSRFGGLKQLQPIGPHGELILEYSVFDAARAAEANGCSIGQVVLVICKETEDHVRATIDQQLKTRMAVRYVHQRPDALPAGFLVPPGRRRQWGTGQAVLAAQGFVRGPFVVINADDFYGASGHQQLARYFQSTAAKTVPAYAVVGYPLRQTLSEHGAVNRGLCAVDQRGRLQSIIELTGIQKQEGAVRYTDAKGHMHLLNGEELVSMNMWGLTPSVFPQLECLFAEFLATRGNEAAAEFYLPTALSTLNERGLAEITLLQSNDSWFGLTYREDLEHTRETIGKLVANGTYPAPLWSA